jgi:hypothetical protein
MPLDAHDDAAASVATATSFAFRSGEATNLVLFALTLGITAVLVLLQRAAVWTVARLARHS